MRTEIIKSPLPFYGQGPNYSHLMIRKEGNGVTFDLVKELEDFLYPETNAGATNTNEFMLRFAIIGITNQDATAVKNIMRSARPATVRTKLNGIEDLHYMFNDWTGVASTNVQNNMPVNIHIDNWNIQARKAGDYLNHYRTNWNVTAGPPATKNSISFTTPATALGSTCIHVIHRAYFDEQVKWQDLITG